MNENEFIKSISDSKKYRDLYLKTIENISQLYSHSEEKVRAKLHQVWGAYYQSRPNFEKLLNKLENDEISLKDILRIHSSTSERLKEYEEIYDFIFKSIESAKSFIDIGCGLNPIFLLLLNKKDLNYTCLDIDNSQQIFLNHAFNKYGYSSYKGIVADALIDNIEPVDVIFAFKVLPVFDQISQIQTDNMLKNIKCKYFVVSFPNKSLGGREKGMRDNYKDMYIKRIESFSFNLKDMREFNNESVYIFNAI